MPTAYYQTVLPPDIEWVAQAFLTPILIPPALPLTVPVKTRLPSPASGSLDVNGFMRIEAGDAVPVTSTWGAAYDVSFLMHAYADDEVVASQISRTAIAHVAAATGLTIVGWYVVSVESVVGGRRLTDPLVPTNLVRYRSAVTWRMAGQPI